MAGEYLKTQVSSMNILWFQYREHSIVIQPMRREARVLENLSNNNLLHWKNKIMCYTIRVSSILEESVMCIQFSALRRFWFEFIGHYAINNSLLSSELLSQYMQSHLLSMSVVPYYFACSFASSRAYLEVL